MEKITLFTILKVRTKLHQILSERELKILKICIFHFPFLSGTNEKIEQSSQKVSKNKKLLLKYIKSDKVRCFLLMTHKV